jgi:hypothetical protein
MRTADLNLLICGWMRDLRLVEFLFFVCLGTSQGVGYFGGKLFGISYLGGEGVAKIFIPNGLLLKYSIYWNGKHAMLILLHGKEIDDPGARKNFEKRNLGTCGGS